MLRRHRAILNISAASVDRSGAFFSTYKTKHPQFSRLFKQNSSRHFSAGSFAVDPSATSEIPFTRELSHEQSPRELANSLETRIVPSDVHDFIEYAQSMLPDSLSFILSNAAYATWFATSVGTWFAMRHQQIQMFQRAQPEIRKQIDKADSLLVELKKLYKNAYSVTSARVRSEKISDLSTEIDMLIDRIKEEEKLVKKYLSHITLKVTYVQLLWKIAFKSLRNAEFKLISHLAIAEMHILCQAKKYNEAAFQVAKALQQYIDYLEDSHSLESHYLSSLKTNYEALLNLIVIASTDRNKGKVEVNADNYHLISEVNEKMRSILEQLKIIATSIDVSESAAWYSEILIYLGYVAHDVRSIVPVELQEVHEELGVLSLIFVILAKRSDPKNYVAYNNLAYCYAMLGDLENAQTHAELCVEMRPSFALGRYNLALILQRKGYVDEAMEHFQIAEQLLVSSPKLEKNESEESATLDSNCQLLHNIQESMAEINKNPFPEKPIISDKKRRLIENFGKPDLALREVNDPHNERLFLEEPTVSAIEERTAQTAVMRNSSYSMRYLRFMEENTPLTLSRRVVENQKPEQPSSPRP